MHPLEIVQGNVAAVEARLGYVFIHKKWLILALTHRSFVNEYRAYVSEHNERLEFLGDSVLGLIVAEFLYSSFPEKPEGELSQLRSRIVDARSCSSYVEKLGIADAILLGKGESFSGSRVRSSILADVFEALVGAIYLDRGWEAARHFILGHFLQDMQEACSAPSCNYKADLQDFAQKTWQKTPVYTLVQATGPDHAKMFEVEVLVGEEALGRGRGLSKKEAEQLSAKEALQKLGKLP